MSDIAFQLTPLDYAHKQIERHFETLILSGQLKAGERLKTTAALAQEFKVTKNTIQKSLAELTRRGLLTRAQKRGTTVSQSACSNVLGVIFGMEDLINPDHAFWGALLSAIEKAAVKAGWTCKPYFGFGEYRFDRVLRELETDQAAGKLRAVVGLSNSGPLSDWMTASCRLPCTHLSAVVDMDYAGFVRQGLGYLVAHQRRHLAIVSNGDPRVPAAVTAAQTESGARAHRDFSVTAPTVGRASGCTTTLQLFQDAQSRPDALLVLDDRACEGAVKALQQLGLRIPQDVALLSWAARNVEIFSPVPITTIEFDLAEAAAVLVTDLQNQIAGRPRQRAGVSLALRPGLSCGEPPTETANCPAWRMEACTLPAPCA